MFKGLCGKCLNKRALIILISSLFLISLGFLLFAEKATGLKETPEPILKSMRKARLKTASRDGGGLPGKVDLSAHFPTPGHQGMIGSCTAWASAYACKSYHENIERGWGVDSEKHLFSPSFIYNQINGGRDGGSALEEAIALMQTKGAASLSEMPYTEDYRKQPSSSAYNEAINYKAKFFSRLNPADANSVKKALSDGQPVLIGMLVHEAFFNYSGGVYSNATGALMGGHAMCTVGYDDSKGAFKIMNSWGTYWGEGGFGWVSYDVYAKNVLTCLVMYDVVDNSPQKLSAPVNVQASEGAYSDQIVLTWDKAQTAQGYIIYRSENAQQSGREIARTKGIKYIDNDIKDSRFYFYTVKSFSAMGESEESEMARGWVVKVEKVDIVKRKPQNLSIKYQDNASYLHWEDMNDVDGYHVYRFNPQQVAFVRAGSTKDSSFRDSGNFNEGETLWYVISAFKDKLESRASEVVFVKVEENIRELDAPKGITASQGKYGDKIELSWKKVDNAREYQVKRWNFKKIDWDLLTETSSTSYTDSKLEEDDNYYVIIAKRGRMLSEESDMVNGYTFNCQTPMKKANFKDKDYQQEEKAVEDPEFTDKSNFKDDKDKDIDTIKFNQWDDWENWDDWDDWNNWDKWDSWKKWNKWDAWDKF